MEDNDYALALALQSSFSDDLPNIRQNSSNFNDKLFKSKSLIDPDWELIDPNPDVFVLFQQFNKAYFWNALSMVEVKWSPRMTLCAGLCCYEGHGMLCSIRLSQPLLKLRPRKDLVETLLHEMIHAYLFVTANNKDRDGHGPEFCKHMHRINATAGTNITIYHTFHDEVDEMRKHWWRCTGSCRNRPPYFGFVKRAMNRQPSKNDYWWNDHQRSCGGTYIKIKEPENYGKKITKSSQKKLGSEARSTPGPVQQTLNFSVGKSKQLEEKGGKVVGDAHTSKRSNPRGIPLNSRLLNSLNHNVKSSQNKTTNALRKLKSNEISLKVQNQISDNQRKSENLTKVCKEMRRTGSQSVNANAPAYSVCKVKTKFLSRGVKGALVFESDDEISSDVEEIMPFNQVMDNAFSKDVSTSLKSNCGSQNNTENRLFPSKNRDKRPSASSFAIQEDCSVGMKRKYTSTVERPKSLSACSPLKKKPNSEHEVETEVADLPSTSKDTCAKSDLSSLSENGGYITSSSNTIVENLNFSCFNKSASNVYDVPTSSQSTEVALPLPNKVACPVCTVLVSANNINMHIDDCLSLKAIQESSF